jgi:hypothetical protein
MNMPIRGQRTATNKKRKKPTPMPTPKKGY